MEVFCCLLFLQSLPCVKVLGNVLVDYVESAIII